MNRIMVLAKIIKPIVVMLTCLAILLIGSDKTVKRGTITGITKNYFII
jgi:hypothetical protein